ncbi:uncharacterized protein LOC124841211 [Vigna umbellata]|uniref:uncharacterized protein LOC124841211 n=1 Tax=Vigna umbellata TaxID=87088 RepID=UPI001F5F2717|nr:uncharacterized protein LOC124841211 [Vigna umbellata]
MKPNDNVPILTKTDSEVSSLSQSSLPRSPRRPVYYVQSPSRESASTRFFGSRKSSSTNRMGPWRDHDLGSHGANGNTGGPSRVWTQESDEHMPCWTKDHCFDYLFFLIYYCLNLSYSENGEGLQILHYEVGKKYEPHYDYFLDEFNTRNGGQRIATVLMYLSDVEEGGETVFLVATANFSSVPWWNDLSQCARKGLSVKPKRGDTLLFWSMRPDASLDPSSLHG